MKGTLGTPLDRRSFLRRTATITAGAAALVAANGVTSGTAHAAIGEATSPTGLAVALVANGITLGWFPECANIGSEHEIAETKLADGSIRKVPGALRFFDVTLKRGISPDRELIDWRHLVEQGKVQEALRMVELQVYDANGRLVMQWQLVNAWPSELVTSGGATMVESLTIVCEQLNRQQ